MIQLRRALQRSQLSLYIYIYGAPAPFHRGSQKVHQTPSITVGLARGKYTHDGRYACLTPEVGKTCQLQGKCRWTPLTRPRSLCTVLAAAAMMAAFPSSTTSAAQHRRHCFAWRLMFAARQIHHACAADAVRLGASRSLHAAKHRASSFAV